jgi:hypothetical protein
MRKPETEQKGHPRMAVTTGTEAVPTKSASVHRRPQLGPASPSLRAVARNSRVTFMTVLTPSNLTSSSRQGKKLHCSYVGRTYTYGGGNIKITVESLALLTLKVPMDPAAGATKTKELIWKKKVEEYVRRKTYLKETVKSLFSLVWGQCTDIMRQKVKALNAFKELSAKNDGIELLKTIKNTAFSFKMQKNAWQASHEAIRHFYMVLQGKHMSTQDYLKHFQNTVKAIEHTVGVVGKLPGLEDKLLVMKGHTLSQMTVAEKEALAPLESQERYLVMAFMLSADRARYGRLLEEMKNKYLKGTNNWPTTVTGAYHLLTN